jgi:tetratricopeptide (TPR) repeat protein
MENSVNTSTPQASGQANLLDGLSVLGLLGGAVAAIAVPANPAAGVIPVAAAVGLHLLNRRQLAEQMLQRQEAATAQVVQQINQHQAALTDYLQKFQQETKHQLDQQQQAQATHHEALSQSLASQGEQLQSQLANLQAEAQQTAQSQAQQHQNLVGVVTELRQMVNYSHHLEAGPKAEAYYQRGLSHQKLGDRPEALRDYSEAIRFNSELAGAYYQRGIIYAELGERKPAVEDLRQAAKLFFDQGDLENYDRARELGKEFYDLQEPFTGILPTKADPPTDAFAYVNGGNGNDDEAPIQPLLAVESNVTADNLFN